MADTHINAYFVAVDEAKDAVARAKGELANAEAALETKKKEIDWQEPTAADEGEETKPEEETRETTSSNPFKKK